MEGELTIIDNLSGSIFHHYSSPAGCEKCHHDKQEVSAAPARELGPRGWGGTSPGGGPARGASRSGWRSARAYLIKAGPGGRGGWAPPLPKPSLACSSAPCRPVVWPQELRGPALGLYTAGDQEGRLLTVVVSCGRRQEAQASPRGQCAFSVTSRGHPGPSSRSSRPEHPGSSSRGPCPGSRAQPRLPRWAFPDGHRRASVALGPSVQAQEALSPLPSHMGP